MSHKIRNQVESLFAEAPKTKKAFELQEELIVNLTEKYDDLVNLGKTPEEAYNNVIASIGDVDELLKGLKQNDMFNMEKAEAERKKTALVVSGAVGLYFLSVIACILLNKVIEVDSTIAGMAFLLLFGGATCILIYHFMSKPRYFKTDETLVEEFKEWKQGRSQKYQIYKSVRSIMWTLTVVLYFLISFTFFIWATSWIIFIVAVVIDQIIKLLFDMSNIKG